MDTHISLASTSTQNTEEIKRVTCLQFSHYKLFSS